jgi:hypothetical protein
MKSKVFTLKFYMGVILIVASLTLGKLTIASFLWSQSSIGQWISIIVYVLSWPMLFWGAWLAGKEYTNSIKKYNSFKFYHDSAKKGAKHMVEQGRKAHTRLVEKVQRRK